MSLRSWVRATLFRLSLRLSPTDAYGGVSLAFLAPGRLEPQVFFEKLHAVLQLIDSRAPRQLRRIAADLGTIALVPAGGEYFDTSFRAYVMDVPTLMHLGIPELALKVVHEATHARILKCGIDHRKFGRRRLEQLCMRQELQFARLLDDAGSLTDWAKARTDTEWWAQEALQARLATQAVAYGIPSWIVRVWSTVMGRGR